ncbi:MAG: nucleotidyltransferase family protein [Pseudomonadales bacterium]
MSILGALILAGGQSHRFGSDKRQAKLPNGEMIVAATVQQALNHFDSVCVVLRANDPALSEMLTKMYPGLHITHAPKAHLGMGHSLAHGVEQIKDWLGVAICLADMPFHHPETLIALNREFEASTARSPIIVPMHSGQAGHPVIFHRNHFDALRNLDGDQGARRVINDNPEHVIRIEIDDPGVVQDIDRPEDL